MSTVLYERTDWFYDLHVPGEEHYLADSIWSHNTGKSVALLHYIFDLAVHHPGLRCLLVRKTAVSLAASGLVTWREKVVPTSIERRAVVYYGGSSQEPAQYRLWNGSKVMIGGMDNSGKVMSTEYDLVFCVDGRTKVYSPSSIERSYCRPYSGQLVTIHTAAGHELTGTPNHPVLTTHGWVPLGQLNLSHHVVSSLRGQDERPGRDPNVDDQPPLIAEIHRALALALPGGTQRIETVPMDFHGDGTHSYVDVVGAAGHLHRRAAAPLLDPLLELDSTGAYFELPILVGGCASGSVVSRMLASSVPGGRLSPEAGHPSPVLVGPGPHHRSGAPLLHERLMPGGADIPGMPQGLPLAGVSPLDSPLAHLLFEPQGPDAQLLGRRLQPGLPQQVAPDRVVEVVRREAPPGWHAYNLQTADHWYYANGIVSHNCQEAIELGENDWEALTTRLRNGVIPRMKILGDTNPWTPTHWLKERANKGTTLMLESRHEDNPSLFTPDGQVTEGGAEYIGKLDRLTGVRFHRLRHGRWVAAEGVVYENWDPAVHLIDRFRIPDSWRRIWVVDFGYTNAFVCQWWAIDPDGRMYLYREYVRTGVIVEDHAKRMLAQVQERALANEKAWKEPKPEAVVCDHDAEDRATLQRHLQLSTRPASKAVKTGIEAGLNRLKVAGDGKPRLFVMRGALIDRDPAMDEAKRPIGLAEEITGYVWAPSQDGKPVKEEPVKLDDHSMDCMRYAVQFADRGGFQIRSFGTR